MEESMKLRSGLNARQWRLYEYLKGQEALTHLRKILDDLRGDYGTYDEHSINNSSARRNLTRDLTELKKNEVIQVVIISTVNGIKLATKEEAETFFRRERIKLLKQLKVLRIQERKALKHNQMRIVFNQERDTYKAFKETEMAN